MTFSPPPEIDLRYLCQDPERYETIVYLVDSYDRQRVPWLKLGKVSLRQKRDYDPHRWELSARMGADKPGYGVPTDFEHDTPYVVCLPLVGVHLVRVASGYTWVTGFITTEAGYSNEEDTDFKVPHEGYDPRKHPESCDCEDTQCISVPLEDGGGPHTIIPEDFYTPPFNSELFQKVKGYRVEILMK